MKFDMPEEPVKEIATSTSKVYKSKLNALSTRGFDSVKKLQEEPEKVIDAIKEITGTDDDEKARHARRTILSAIFWVAAMPKKNAYHTFWQKNIPLNVVGGEHDGEKWVKKSKYTG
jgi:hypothetical protein